jgi:MoxR-like ATPase
MNDMNTVIVRDVDLATGTNIVARLINGLENVIKGRSDTIKLILTSLFADGHALLEDYPGSGKTTLAKTLGKLISKGETSNPAGHGDEKLYSDAIIPFRRIQFTPDMLPGDVLGVNIFEPREGVFRFIHGPIFAHIVLADEINRTGPKVQAAFLECMAEKQVTIDNRTHPLHPLFFVLGTQNPLDFAGTYPLPLVQLDRFLLKIPMSYVDPTTENKILEEHDRISHETEHCKPVASVNEILAVRQLVKQIHVSPGLRMAIVSILQATRTNPGLEFGASTRAGLMLQSALKAFALLEGRDYCTEDDLVTILPYVLLHRLRFKINTQSPHEQLKALSMPFIERAIAKNL